MRTFKLKICQAEKKPQLNRNEILTPMWGFSAFLSLSLSKLYWIIVLMYCTFLAIEYVISCVHADLYWFSSVISTTSSAPFLVTPESPVKIAYLVSSTSKSPSLSTAWLNLESLCTVFSIPPVVLLNLVLFSSGKNNHLNFYLPHGFIRFSYNLPR